MPPETMTMVAPTAMIAKKLASVAAWIKVYELRKLLTSTPDRGSTCDPANSVSTVPSRTITTTSPNWDDAQTRRSMRGDITGKRVLGGTGVRGYGRYGRYGRYGGAPSL